jgi:hypothetical protein
MDKGKARKLLSMAIDAYRAHGYFQQVADGVPLLPFGTAQILPAVFVSLLDGRMEPLTARGKTEYLSFTVTGIYHEEKHPDLIGCDVKDVIEEVLADLEQTAAWQNEGGVLSIKNFRTGPNVTYGPSNFTRVDPPRYAIAVDCEIEFDYDTTT